VKRVWSSIIFVVAKYDKDILDDSLGFSFPVGPESNQPNREFIALAREKGYGAQVDTSHS
jgi:hypothetical protein